MLEGKHSSVGVARPGVAGAVLQITLLLIKILFIYSNDIPLSPFKPYHASTTKARKLKL